MAVASAHSYVQRSSAWTRGASLIWMTSRSPIQTPSAEPRGRSGRVPALRYAWLIWRWPLGHNRRMSRAESGRRLRFSPPAVVALTAVATIGLVAATSRGSVHLPVPGGLDFNGSATPTAAAGSSVQPASASTGGVTSSFGPAREQLSPRSRSGVPIGAAAGLTEPAAGQPAAGTTTASVEAPVSGAGTTRSDSPSPQAAAVQDTSASTTAPAQHSDYPAAPAASSPTGSAPRSSAPSSDSSTAAKQAARTSGSTSSGSQDGQSNDGGGAANQNSGAHPSGDGESGSSSGSRGDSPATTVTPDYPVVSSQALRSRHSERTDQSGRSPGLSQRGR